LIDEMMNSNTMSAPSLLQLAAASLIFLPFLSSICVAFIQPVVHVQKVPQTTLISLFSTKEQILTQSSIDKLDTIKLALKRPRGASISIEYNPSSDISLSDGDLSILSMSLRKSKCSSIFTSDVSAVKKIAKEQESSRGDFPGPVPVIYCGKELDSAVISDDDIGASAVVVEYESADKVDMESLQNVGIIWKVNFIQQIQQLVDMESHAGGVYMLSKDMLPSSIEDDALVLKDILSSLPKSVVTIAPLQSMLPENAEVSLGKHYASLGISSLLLSNACVGDEEDIKYSQFVIDGINKKSSSSFSMTGLTGSANGHFGVSSHEGEVKWRRNE